MRTVTTFILFAVAILYAPTALAMGPSAAVLVGNGFNDGYNLGFGARAGFTLPLSVYVGGTFVYHLGKTESTPAGDVNLRVLYVGAEGGYDAGVGPLTLRPYLGLGYASATGSALGLSSSEGKAALWPGVTALFGLGGLFVGADARYVVLLDTEDANAFSVFATVGTTF